MCIWFQQHTLTIDTASMKSTTRLIFNTKYRLNVTTTNNLYLTYLI